MSLEKELIKDIYNTIKFKEHPTSCQLEIILQRLRLSGAIPKTSADQIKFTSILIVLTFNIATIFYNIATTNDVIEALDSALILMGFLLILCKFYDFEQNSVAVSNLVTKVIQYYKKITLNVHPEIQSKFRVLFAGNAILNYIWGITLGVSLFVALTFQPIISWQMTLPMKAKYPFEISSPIVFFGVALFQNLMYAYNLFLIVIFDSTIVCIICYTFIAFELLHHKTKGLDKPGINDEQARGLLKEIILEHQFLIEIVNETNKTFKGSLIAQMVASYSMLGFSGFMTVATMDSPMLCLRFAVYFFAVLCDTVFWCVNGHQTFYSSEYLSDVLLECNWLDRSVKFRKDFLYVVARCQKPLYFEADSIFIFNYHTLLTICRKSYTSFALLRNMLTDIKF